MKRTMEVNRLIEVARDSDAIIYVEAYCRGSGCPLREVTLRVKDYDGELMPLLTRRGLSCPLCGKVLAVHWAKTQHQYSDSVDRAARMSVSTQMRHRDSRSAGNDGLLFLRLDEMLDERLPPTPDGWFDRSDSAIPTKRRQFFSKKDTTK